MKVCRPLVFSLLLVLAAGLSASCAQDVPDINRVQPNALKKSDFEGVWYVRHTIIDVPPDNSVYVGVSSGMEKIRWDIQKDYLVAYRAYESVPGYDQQAGGKTNGQTQYADGVSEGRNPGYKEQPVAMYPIVGHFDIQRQYNSATGEQSNVIVENASDRPWNERNYFRVDWSHNLINISWPAILDDVSDGGFYVDETATTDESFYTEHDQLDDDSAQELSYFDFVAKYELDSNEVKIRSSFYRLPEYQRDYQPIYYSDKMMTKFGYFRTTRPVYNRGYGFTDDGMVYLADRHDIWKNDYKRDDNGEYLRDADGRRLPTPMAEREPKPVVYYLSPQFPDDMRPGAEGVAKDWNRAFTRAAAAAKGMDPKDFTDKYGDMFVLCDPVIEADSANRELCDPRPAQDQVDSKGNYKPFHAELGDLRLSFMVYVHQPQANGLLGYGPSYPDPETGEIISGTAYVYGASVDSYAQYGLDIVRFVNGDLSLDDMHNGDYVRKYVMSQMKQGVDPRTENSPEQNAKLAQISVKDVPQAVLPQNVKGILSTIKHDGLEQMKVSPTYVQQKVDRMKAAGLDKQLIDDEFVRAVAGKDASPANLSDQDIKDILSKQNPLELDKFHQAQTSKVMKEAKNNMYMADFADPAVIGTALRFKGRTDYEAIRNEIRNEIYHAVTAHEVGHTLGLRHNFQGSWDAVNFPDKYWQLRKENFKLPTNLQEMYETSAVTQNQAEGDIGSEEYSSIMDYTARFNSDWSGIGKYDEAAILFAYTFGTYDDLKADHTGTIPVEAGYVEVWDSLPDSVYLPQYDQTVDPKQVFDGYDDRYAASQHPLEDFHYTTVVSLLGGPDNLTKRHLMRYDQLHKLQQDNDTSRPVEVQYMFCSDEWVGATMSCDMWDLGADPLEVARSAIQSYKAYYPFTHFRRNRYNFSSLSGASRAARTFNKMPQIYQRWFFNQYYGGDPILSNYYLFGAYAGFNLLSEVLSMPGYGGYKLDSQTGTYKQTDTNADCQPGGDVDMCVHPGNGRTLYSRYDYGSGYYYFTRVAETGHYWDSLFAMMAMTQSVATALGVDVQGDMTSYLLPYYLVFDNQLTKYFNGMVQGETTSFAPVYSPSSGLRFRPAATLGLQGGGQVVPLTGEVISSGSQLNGDEKPVQVRTAWMEQLYSLAYGIAYFNSSYSQHYIDQARVFKLGNGEQLSAPQGGDYEVITVTDPHTGISYGALAKTGVSADQLGLGAQLIRKAQDEVDRMNNGDSNASYQLDSTVEDINRVIGVVDALGHERY